MVSDEFGSAQECGVFLRGLCGGDNIGSLLGGGRGVADVVLDVLHGVSAGKWDGLMIRSSEREFNRMQGDGSNDTGEGD